MVTQPLHFIGKLNNKEEIPRGTSSPWQYYVLSVLPLSHRANRLFTCVRVAPVSNNVEKYILVCNYIHTSANISYSSRINAPIVGQNYIALFFSQLTYYFGRCCWLQLCILLKYAISFPCVFWGNAQECWDLRVLSSAVLKLCEICVWAREAQSQSSKSFMPCLRIKRKLKPDIQQFVFTNFKVQTANKSEDKTS